jgi:PAS domain S-box-containing protein
MKRLFDPVLLIAFGLLTAAIVINGAVTYRSVDALHSDTQTITHTHEVLKSLAKVISLAKDAETGQRGYVITQEKTYLEPYLAATAAIDEEIDELEKLTASSAFHQAELPKLRQAWAAKLGELEQTIAKVDADDLAGAQELVNTDSGKQAMDALRAQVERMTNREQAHREELLAHARETYRRSAWSSLAGNVVGIGALAAFFLVLRRHLAARQRDAAVIYEQGERFRTTLASIGDAVMTVDTRARVTYLNAVAEELTGWKCDEAQGRSMHEVFNIVNETTRAPAENPVDRVLREGITVGLANHTILISKKGLERAIDDSAAPIRNAEGRIEGVVLVFRDVAERRKTERQLAISQARKTAILESAMDAILTIDAEGKLITFNPAAEKMFGRRREEVVGRDMAELIVPEGERDAFRRGLTHFLVTGDGPILGKRIERKALRATGEEFPVDVAVTPIKTEAELFFTGYVRDLTEQKRAEEALREAEQQFRTLADTIPQLAWMAQPDGSLFWFNQRSLDFTGRTLDELKGWKWEGLLDPREAPHVLKKFRASVASGDDWEDTFQLRRHDGEMRWHLGRMHPIRDDHGKIVRWFGTNTDVTDQIEAANELRALAADLSEADRRKDVFLATLAHELRNPLAPIRNALSVLKHRRDDSQAFDETREMLERQVQQMVRLIDDLLDLSRISRNRIELRKEDAILSEVIDHAVETCRPVVDEAEHALIVDVPAEPIHLHADKVRVAQIVANLLNNSAKYTERGGEIRLTARAQGGQAIISVKDNGIGIPREMLGHVFDMFTQIDPSLERAQGGLGIGLTLVKRLVEMHGGAIDAQSEGPGRGSEFVVRLPIAPPRNGAPQPAPAVVDADPPRRKILVVDDNRDSAKSLAMLLKLRGHEVHTAFDGMEAFTAAESVQPEVVLLDIGLPKLNGYEVARKIREQPWGESIVLVALTGWGQDEDRRKSKEAGFDHHFVKPVEQSVLNSYLASLEA